MKHNLTDHCNSFKNINNIPPVTINWQIVTNHDKVSLSFTISYWGFLATDCMRTKTYTLQHFIGKLAPSTSKYWSDSQHKLGVSCSSFQTVNNLRSATFHAHGTKAFRWDRQHTLGVHCKSFPLDENLLAEFHGHQFTTFGEIANTA